MNVPNPYPHISRYIYSSNGDIEYHEVEDCPACAWQKGYEAAMTVAIKVVEES